MRRGETLEVFGLSFLDLISCGLGGVIVLMLIFASLSGQGGDAPRAVAAGKAAAEARPAATFILLQVDVTADEQSQFDLVPRGASTALTVRRPQMTELGGESATVRFLVEGETADLPPGTGELAFQLVPEKRTESYQVEVRLLSDISRQETAQISRTGTITITVADLQKLPKIVMEGI
jgi:hypothetical protein